MRCAGLLAVDDVADLAQLVHQVLLGVQAPRGVDDHHVVAAGASGLDGVVGHRSWVGPRLAPNQLGPGALRPGLELLGRGGAEGVRGDHQDG